MKDKWQKCLNPLRFTSNGPKILESELRNPFIIDQDRILFSSSFRRLAKKTQVHPLTRNDHIHNRLTHSLEVACVARTIGLHIGYFIQKEGHIPDAVEPYNIGEIVYAACLAHDIGNPPFGHAGESAIQDWFKDSDNEQFIKELTKKQQMDFQSFDGNAQGLRVITALENNKDKGGLRLSFPTIAAIVKYPRSSYEALGMENTKFNYYQSEQSIFEEIFSSLGLSNGKGYSRHPLSYVTEIADDICYRIVDIEDALELKIISFDEIINVISPIEKIINIDKEKLNCMDSDRRRLSMLRTLIIKEMVKSAVEAFKEKYKQIMEGTTSPLIAHCNIQCREYMDKAKDIFNNKIKNEPQKMALEIGAYGTYKILLDVFIPATFNKIKKMKLSYKDTRALDLMGVNAPVENDNLYLAYLRVIDFVTGMTDSYATFISRQFSGTAVGQ